MRSTVLLAACAALALAGAAEAKSKAKRKPPPPPPPRVWHYFDDAPSPFLQYSYLRIADGRRTVLSCENSGVVRIEQLQSGRPGPGVLLVIDSDGQSDAEVAEVTRDTMENTASASVSATFPIDRPALQAFGATGALRLAVGANTYILPPAPSELVARFMDQCSP